MAQKSLIAIYTGEGVERNAFALLSTLFAKIRPHYTCQAVDRSFFLQSSFQQKTALIVMPGGRDRPYTQALNGPANACIRAFVERGGAYMGICAGAYYGCAQVNFERGTALEVVGSRELGFFSGEAIGPVYGKGLFSYRGHAGARLAQIDSLVGGLPVYYNGGCSFIGSFDRLLASYSDLPGKPPAAIGCQVEQGRVVLTGVHPEYTSQVVPQHLAHPLDQTKAIREHFFQSLLDFLRL